MNKKKKAFQRGNTQHKRKFVYSNNILHNAIDTILYVLIVVVLYPADGDDERDGDVEIGGEHDDVGTVVGEH